MGPEAPKPSPSHKYLGMPLPWSFLSVHRFITVLVIKREFDLRFSLQVFSRAGDIKRIIMGLDKNQLTPCGFAFVVYYTREDAEDAVKYISGTIMDDRPVRVDFDWGFKDGRQFGRGRSGGQAGSLPHVYCSHLSDENHILQLGKCTPLLVARMSLCCCRLCVRHI